MARSGYVFINPLAVLWHDCGIIRSNERPVFRSLLNIGVLRIYVLESKDGCFVFFYSFIFFIYFFFPLLLGVLLKLTFHRSTHNRLLVIIRYQ
jgi:hypothetical protein